MDDNSAIALPRGLLIALSTLATAAVADPRGFFDKVRIRLEERPAFAKLIGAILPARSPVGVLDDTSGADFLLPIERVDKIDSPSMARPNALYYVNSCLPYSVSGYTVRTQQLVNASRGKGWRIIPVTRVGYPASIGKLPRTAITRVAGVEYLHLLPLLPRFRRRERWERSVRLLVAHASSQKCSVLHTTTDFKNAAVVSAAARRLSLPWVYEVRGERDKTLATLAGGKKGISPEFVRNFRRSETRAMRSASAVIAISEIAKTDIVARGVASERVHVVPNGVSSEVLDTDWDRDDARAALGLDAGARLVGSVTSVVDYEGLDCLIESLPLLNDDVKVLIVGEGQARRSLEQLAERLGVSNRVLFVGRQPAESIERWYAALDVFVVPRKDVEVCRRVTPIKPLVALAIGLPVVASDLPALREVTGGFARFVTPGDRVEFAAAVNQALDSSNGVSDFERNRLEAFLRSRTWEANASQLAEIYRSLVAGHDEPSRL